MQAIVGHTSRGLHELCATDVKKKKKKKGHRKHVI